MLRTVGLDYILTSVLCLRQGWYVVYQHVRKVHPFMLRGILGFAVFGLSGFFFVFCARWGYWAGFCAFIWLRPLGVGRLGHYLHDLLEESMAVHNTVTILGNGLLFLRGHLRTLKPYVLALVGRPSLHGYCACMVFWVKGGTLEKLQA